MNANPMAKHYDQLTPGERFRLILAAGARGDEAERKRLVNAGRRITLSMADHAPDAHAFSELAWVTFVELMEYAAGYFDAFTSAEIDSLRADDGEAEQGDEAGGSADDNEPEATAGAGPDTEAGEDFADGDSAEPGWQGGLDLILAAGFILKTKAGGWKLFCERMGIPPFVVWDGLPGCERLRRALQGAERAAFVPEGMLRWMNAIRPEGDPEVTAERLLSAEKEADVLEGAFRKRVAWWGG